MWYNLRIVDRGGYSYEPRLVSRSIPLALRELPAESRGLFWTGDESTAVFARSRLDECLEKHAHCSRSFSEGWKPSRLLDISGDEVKLVRGTSVDGQAQYVTLSHCWGEEQFLILTPALLPRFLSGVHISEFLLTFRETITFVRRLRIRYLWIDCYCILQGDEEAKLDWKRESLVMGKVYAHSLLNIGALESTAPSGSLFRSHRPSHINSAKFYWSPTRRDGTNLFDIAGVQRDPWQAIMKMASSNLMRRGWVVQECVLAPWMLSFAREEVIWQCMQKCDIEGLPGYESTIGPTLPLIWYWSSFWLLNNLSRIDRYSSLDLRSLWLVTLHGYCKSRLTYPKKDLFAALDGIGAELAKRSDSRFGNGVLEPALLETLLYAYTSHDFSSRGDQRDCTRPTWHWSSGYFEVDFAQMQSGSKFPMAYAFMSDDCSPLTDETSGDYWPNLILIGRLMAQAPPCKFLDHGMKEEEFNAHKARLYLPLVSRAPLINGGANGVSRPRLGAM